MIKRRNVQTIQIEDDDIVYEDNLEVRLVGSQRQLKRAVKMLKNASFKWRTDYKAYPVKNKYGDETPGKYALVLKYFRQEDIDDDDDIIIIDTDDD